MQFKLVFAFPNFHFLVEDLVDQTICTLRLLLTIIGLIRLTAPSRRSIMRKAPMDIAVGILIILAWADIASTKVCFLQIIK